MLGRVPRMFLCFSEDLGMKLNLRTNVQILCPNSAFMLVCITQ